MYIFAVCHYMSHTRLSLGRSLLKSCWRTFALMARTLLWWTRLAWTVDSNHKSYMLTGFFPRSKRKSRWKLQLWNWTLTSHCLWHKMDFRRWHPLPHAQCFSWSLDLRRRKLCSRQRSNWRPLILQTLKGGSAKFICNTLSSVSAMRPAGTWGFAWQLTMNNESLGNRETWGHR